MANKGPFRLASAGIMRSMCEDGVLWVEGGCLQKRKERWMEGRWRELVRWMEGTDWINKGNKYAE